LAEIPGRLIYQPSTESPGFAGRRGVWPTSPPRNPRVPHFSHSLREVGLSQLIRNLRRADLHLHLRPVVHHDRPRFPKSTSSEAAPPPLIETFHQPAFDRVAMQIRQLLAMLVRTPY